MEMKKIMCLILIVLVFVPAITLPGNADGAVVVRGGHWHGGWHGGWRGGAWVGPGWGWGWGGPWWGYPAYPYYYPNYYSTPPVVMEQQPQTYVEPAPQREEQYYWYYCGNPKGYYPYVKRCPDGWQRVLPSPPPGSGEEQ